MVKPGFPLTASLEVQANDAVWIRITLPGGVETLTSGPAIPLAQIGPLNVMYYPGQFVQILAPTSGTPPSTYQRRIPIADLPPHKET